MRRTSKPRKRATVLDRHHLAEQPVVAWPIGEDLGRALGIGIARMIGDQHPQPLGILAGQIGHVDAAMRFQIVVVAEFLLGDLPLFRHWLELDHRHVAARFEGVVLVEYIGDAARHAGGEISAGRRIFWLRLGVEVSDG